VCYNTFFYFTFWVAYTLPHLTAFDLIEPATRCATSDGFELRPPYEKRGE
jgi:hypothetical protein